MGLLSQIDTQAAQEDKPSSAPWRNVALRIVSYDVDNRITTGVDVSSGETVKVRLADPARPGRDDIDVWSQQRFRERRGVRELANNKAVVAGDEEEAGVIIFEAVRPSKTEGVMEARWAVTAAHSAMDASVIKVMARPIPSRGDLNQVNPSLGIEMIRSIAAAPVMTTSEISEQITNVLSTAFTQAVVRAQDEDGKVLSAVVKRPFTDELKALTQKVNDAGAEAEKAGKSLPEVRTAKRKARQALATQFAEADQHAIDEAAPSFFKSDALGTLLGKLTPEQISGLKLEVFALEQVYPGEKYKEALGKSNGVDGMSFRRDWSMDGKGFGFTETYVALRVHDEGGMQLTKIRAASTRPELYASLNDIPTPNIQPASTPVISNTVGEDVSAYAPGAAQSEPASALTGDALDSKLAAAARGLGRRG